jgi:hypothetical protein
LLNNTLAQYLVLFVIVADLGRSCKEKFFTIMAEGVEELGAETGTSRMAGDRIGARRVSGTGRGRQAGDGGAGTRNMENSTFGVRLDGRSDT